MGGRGGGGGGHGGRRAGGREGRARRRHSSHRLCFDADNPFFDPDCAVDWEQTQTADEVPA